MTAELEVSVLPKGWSRTTLGELCESGGGNIQTGPFGSQLHSADYVEVGIPSIMPTNIAVEGIQTDGIARIRQEDAERLQKYRVRAGDIVYSRRGDIEKCAMVTAEETGWLCGTGCLRVRLGNSAVTPQFLHAYLSCPAVRAWIVRHSIGATMPNLNTGILKSLPIEIPPIEELQAIGSIWESLVARSNNLISENQILEAITRAIFKSWFVDFDPVRAKAEGRQPEGMDATTAALFPSDFELGSGKQIPTGWSVLSFSDASEVVYGAAFSSKNFNTIGRGLPLIRIRDLKTMRPDIFTTETHSKGCLVLPGDVVVGMDGEFRAYHWLGEPGWLNQRVCYFRPKNLGGRSFIRESLRPLLDRVERGQVGTTVIHIGKGDIDRFQTVIPSDRVMKVFNDLTDRLLDRIICNAEILRSLAAIRDSLLPRLISGKLRVPEDEKMVEALV